MKNAHWFRSRTLLAGLAAVWLGGTATAAYPMALCVRAQSAGEIKEGARVRLRSACKAKEVMLPISIDQGLVRVSGANLQVVNGSGDTGGQDNGLGNLIVGYNEDGDAVPNERTGSHNIVLGPDHHYASHGGLVAGASNRILGPHATVTGGSNNTAEGELSSVGGGADNQARARFSSVGAGDNNTAAGEFSSVVGGRFNVTNGFASAILGGEENGADGGFSAVCGGAENSAAGPRSTVGGGIDRHALGEGDWTAGSLFEDD